MSSVWVLSRGSYSDYSVLCVVDGDEDAAKTLAARVNAADRFDEVFPEELSVVSPDIERVEILRLQAEIFDDGRVQERDPIIRIEWPFDSLFGAPPVRWRWVRAPMYRGQGGRLDVWGTDHERVRRVFSDRRAEFLATESLRIRHEAEGGR